MTCGECLSWVQIQSAVVTGPRQGQCRALPPQLLVLGMTAQGPAIVAEYPVLDERTPRCGLFKAAARLVVPTTNGEGQG